MEPFSPAFFHNKVFWFGFAGWAVGQTSKVFLGVITQRRFDFRWLIGTGGMPSSHASGVSALATAIGVKEGWTSTIFALAFVVAFITMFDAQGVRRAAGRQAAVLNKIVDELYLHGRVSEEKLWELLGHTRVEVFAGFILGVSTALLCIHKWGI